MTGRPTRYVMFLRGINVGGHRKVPMAALREVITEVTGDPDPKTYIASGNAVFVSDMPKDSLTVDLHAAIETRFGFAVPVLLLTARQVAAVLRTCPWPDAEGKTVHAHLCFAEPLVDPELVARWSTSGEVVVVAGTTVWLLTPNGLGKSKLAERLTLGAESTARNLNTLRICAKMVESG